MVGNEAIQKAVEEILPGCKNVFDVIRETLEDGKEKVTVVLSNEIQTPVRCESRPSNHLFHTVQGFAKYIEEYGSKDTVVLIDTPNKRVAAVIDEIAKEGHEVCQLKPETHPMFVEWEELLKQKNVVLDEFVEFLMVHKKQIVDPDPQQLILALSQVRASVSTTIHKGRVTQNHALNGILCKTSVDGGVDEGTGEIVSLPDAVQVESSIFVGDDVVKVTIDLLIKPVGDNILVRVSSPDLAEVVLARFQVMSDEIVKKCKGMVAYGQVCFADWRYVQKP